MRSENYLIIKHNLSVQKKLAQEVIKARMIISIISQNTTFI